MDLAKSHLKIPRGDFHISIQKPSKSQFILPSASGSKLCENFHKLVKNILLAYNKNILYNNNVRKIRWCGNERS